MAVWEDVVRVLSCSLKERYHGLMGGRGSYLCRKEDTGQSAGFGIKTPGSLISWP